MQMRDRARGDEKALKSYILGIEKAHPDLKSIMGYHLEDNKEFVRVRSIHKQIIEYFFLIITPIIY